MRCSRSRSAAGSRRARRPGCLDASTPGGCRRCGRFPRTNRHCGDRSPLNLVFHHFESCANILNYATGGIAHHSTGAMTTFTAQQATDAAFDLAEGVLWDDRASLVRWVDIWKGRVLSGSLRDGRIVDIATVELGQTAGAVA